MEVAVVIVITFVFPAIVIALVWYWMRSLKRHVDEREREHMKTYDIMEKVIKTKDKIIEKLKF